MLKTYSKLEAGLDHTRFHLPWDTCTQEEALVGKGGRAGGGNGRRQAAGQTGAGNRETICPHLSHG